MKKSIKTFTLWMITFVVVIFLVQAALNNPETKMKYSELMSKIENGEVTPSKILNVFRDETFLTYENKFINTLLIRLIAFIEKRFSVLNGTSAIEKNYVFDYQTSFHHSLLESEKNSAKLSLKIELTSPMKDNLTDEEIAGNEELMSIHYKDYTIYKDLLAKKDELEALLLAKMERWEYLNNLYEQSQKK